jgi:molecular chaperone DnaJ
LKGKGFPAVNSYEKGDQLIYVNVWTPQNLTAEERAMLEKMNNSPNFKPQPDKSDKNFFDKVREMFS